MDHSCKSLLIAALALMAPVLAACTPATPKTELRWSANDRVESRQLDDLPPPVSRPAHPAVRTAKRKTAKTYIYEGDAPAVPAPTPRPHYLPSPVPAHDEARPVYSPRGDVAFAWPLNGTVISSFGATTNGGRNDGINIATTTGAPIHASAGGTVTYAGNELKGYGNLLLIKHADGYVTAYAHADRLSVARGDTVSKGQVIGYAGSTGDVDSPQLHFEIRHDTTPVNPKSLLVARNS